MKDLLSFLAFTFFGMCVGALLLARWWVYRVNQPVVARNMLRGLYRKAHPHWLSVSAADATPLCPCCGWSGERMREQDEPEGKEEVKT
jgi:hypothetical protein